MDESPGERMKFFSRFFALGVPLNPSTHLIVDESTSRHAPERGRGGHSVRRESIIGEESVAYDVGQTSSPKISRRISRASQYLLVKSRTNHYGITLFARRVFIRNRPLSEESKRDGFFRRGVGDGGDGDGSRSRVRASASADAAAISSIAGGTSSRAAHASPSSL